MRNAMRLGFFVLVSFAIHALLYLRTTDRDESLLDDIFRSVPREIAALGTTVVPIVETTESASPVEPQTEPNVEPDEESPPAKLTRNAPEEGVDQGTPEQPTAPEPRPEPTDQGTDVIQTPFETRADYFRQVFTRADLAPKDGTPVPDLVIDLNVPYADMLSVIRFYAMKVVAYPLSGDETPTFYLELTGDELDAVTRREGRDLLTGFSNRARDLTGHPAFWSVLSRAAAGNHIDPYHARIAAVVPQRVDRYFLHKQREAAKRVGLSLDAVRSTQGRLRRTNVGWLLDIHAVTPNEGATIRIGLDPSAEWE